MATEQTPLLSQEQESAPSVAVKPSIFSPYARILLTSFLLAVAFVYTATPLLFAFRVFVCDEYYKVHPPFTGTGDRCHVPSIESQTAESIALMGTFTTIAGLANLLTTSAIIRMWGVRAAMVSQTAFPALRNVCQTTAIYIGGWTGIRIIQWTQFLTIGGGGAGYFLVANSYVAELVEAEARTASFSVLQGVSMLGTAVGFTLGGITSDFGGLPAPFEVTLGLLIFSTFFSAFFLPYIAPPAQPVQAADGSQTEKKNGIMSGLGAFFQPLSVFLPTRLPSANGGYLFFGLTLLGLGTFLAALATGFVSMMLQLYATNVFGFTPRNNGYLMSMISMSRALFLTMGMPQIIRAGRKWYTSTSKPAPVQPPVNKPLPNTAEAFEPLPVIPEAQEPVKPPEPTDAAHGSHFDLVFLRLSILVDALLTGCLVLLSEGWHLYLAAVVLPVASGTAPAAKGVVLDMITADRKSDALAAISIVETLAMIATISVFGTGFAYFSDKGQPSTIFLFNSGTALVAFCILAFSRFPRPPPKTSSV